MTEPETSVAQAAPYNWQRRQGDLFEDRLAAWLRLRGELATHSAGSSTVTPDGEDAYANRHNDLTERLEGAARLAMTTLATQAWMVWRKFEILEAAVAECEGRPDHIDFRQLWMISAIKADVAFLGLGRSSEGYEQ